MKGFFIFITLLTSLLSLVMTNCSYANDSKILQHTDSILILKSKESSYYNQTIQAIVNTAPEGLHFDIQNISQNPYLNNAQLIITLGNSAALYAREHFPDNKKIFTFLNLSQSLLLQAKDNEIHLLIELPTSTYISFANTVLPNKRLGILYQKSVTNLSELTDNNLYLIEVQRRNKVIQATRDLLKSADALIALPNKDIFNRHSLKGIILSSYQSNIPFISYSPAHVKAGAIAAIYASPVNLGEHTSDIIKGLIAKIQYKPMRHFAKYFSIKINQRVAQSLGLTLYNAKQFSTLIKINN